MLSKIKNARRVISFFKNSVVILSFLVPAIIFSMFFSPLVVAEILIIGIVGLAPFWYFIIPIELEEDQLNLDVLSIFYDPISKEISYNGFKIFYIVYPLTIGLIFTIYYPYYLLIYISIYVLFTNFAAVQELMNFSFDNKDFKKWFFAFSALITIVGNFVLFLPGDFDVLLSNLSKFLFIPANIFVWSKSLKEKGFFTQWKEAKNIENAYIRDNKLSSQDSSAPELRKIFLILFLYIIFWPIIADFGSDYIIHNLINLNPGDLENFDFYQSMFILFYSVLGIITGLIYSKTIAINEGDESFLSINSKIKSYNSLKKDLKLIMENKDKELNDLEIKAPQNAIILLACSLIIVFLPIYFILMYIISCIVILPKAEKILKIKAYLYHNVPENVNKLIDKFRYLEEGLKNLGYPVENMEEIEALRNIKKREIKKSKSNQNLGFIPQRNLSNQKDNSFNDNHEIIIRYRNGFLNEVKKKHHEGDENFKQIMEEYFKKLGITRNHRIIAQNNREIPQSSWNRPLNDMLNEYGNDFSLRGNRGFF